MATIDELTIADDPQRWAQLGFQVDGDRCQLAGVRLRLAGRQDARGILGWSLRDVDGPDVDGLPTTRSERPPAPPALMHPNGVVGIDHIVAMSPDLDRTVATLQDAGLDLRRIREEPTAAGAPRQGFFRLGREILEVVQEPEEVVSARPDGTAGPARFWGLALLVEDIDSTVAAMAPHVPPPRAAVQAGRRIATVSRSAQLAVPVALMSRDERVGEER